MRGPRGQGLPQQRHLRRAQHLRVRCRLERGGLRRHCDAPKVDRKAEKREAAQWREKQKAAKNAVSKAEREMAALAAERSRIDQALFDPKAATGAEAKMTTSELMVKRAAVEKKLEAAEEVWMEASAALEAL